MKIYLIEGSEDFGKYARFSHVGTWGPGGLCEKCEQPISRLVQPLLVEWESDSNVIGDFSWCGYTAIVTQGVDDLLLEKGLRCDFGSVNVVKTKSTSRGPIVPYPYVGPDLKWLLPKEKLFLNESKSNVGLIIDCDACGQKKYNFKRDGLCIDKRDWSGEKIFRIGQYARSAAMYVTEEAVHELRMESFSNLSFFDAGVIE